MYSSHQTEGAWGWFARGRETFTREVGAFYKRGVNHLLAARKTLAVCQTQTAAVRGSPHRPPPGAATTARSRQ